MTMETAGSDMHLGDEEIGGFIEGECSPVEEARIEAHLAVCEACAESVALLRHWSNAFSAAVAPVDPEPPALPEPTIAAGTARPISRTRWIPVYWKAAAMIAMALGLTLTAAPARAWITERWADLVAFIDGAADRPAPSAPVTSPVEGAVVSVVPLSDRFVLDLATEPAGGAVRIHRSDVATASVQLVEGAEGHDLVVLSGTVRVINPAGSRAEYRVVLPNTLPEFELRIAGRVARSYRIDGPEPAALETIRFLDLP
jgi:anti-sigma factor RsiW